MPDYVSKLATITVMPMLVKLWCTNVWSCAEKQSHLTWYRYRNMIQPDKDTAKKQNRMQLGYMRVYPHIRAHAHFSAITLSITWIQK